MSQNNLLFPEDGAARPTMRPHRGAKEAKKKKRRRKKRLDNHGLKDGQGPEGEEEPEPPRRYYVRRKDKYLEPALEVKGRPIYLPSLSDPDPFLIERLLGTPLVF